MKKIFLIGLTIIFMNSCKECKCYKETIVGKKTEGTKYILGISNGDGIFVRYGAYCMLDIGDTVSYSCGIYDLKGNCEK